MVRIVDVELERIAEDRRGLFERDAVLSQVEEDALETWFAFVAERQAEAADWIDSRFTDYSRAPGAEISVREQFGEVEAGFFTLQPFDFDDPDPLRPASLVGFFVEDIEALRD